MFIPYSTDAPIYHWPVATVGLIVANVVFFIAVLTGQSDVEMWILPYGEGLTPVQWLTSMFMHASIEHLLGNMLFLWLFGLVVEGKIGWLRFLGCYLGIGIAQSVGEQSLQLLLGGQGGSLGASSAIYGLLAMAAVWAPKNEISFFYFIWFFLIYTGTVEVSIMIVALLYIGYDVVFAFILGLNSSSWLHVGGAMIGAPLAIIMLKRGKVDCEGWDIFHVLRDDLGGMEEKKRESSPERIAALQEQRDSQILENAKQQLEFLFQAGNYLAGYKLVQKMQRVGDGLQLSGHQLQKIVAAMHKEKQWRESCPLMMELIERYPGKSQPAQIKLAQICVVELQKPGRALDLLKVLDLQSLTPAQLGLVKKIALRAKQMQAEGIVELDDDKW